MTRNEIIRQAEQTIPQLTLHDSLTFSMPFDPLDRHVIQRNIEWLAEHAFGARCYSIKIDFSRLTLTRTNKQVPGGQRRAGA